MRRSPDSPEKLRVVIPSLESISTFNDAEPLQGILTAISVGERWCIKAISASGEVVRVGSFDRRLTALGAAVLLVKRTGARIVP